MAFLGPLVDLQKLWEERSKLPDFKLRDEAYNVYRNAYLSRTADSEQQQITWRPIMLDGQTADTKGREPINLAKSIGLHHTATAARPPRVWNEPGADQGEEVPLKNTAVIQYVFRDSLMKLLQTQQANHLAVRGDAAYAVLWNQDKDARRKLWVRVAKPDYCYPAIDDAEDPGALKDMLVSYEVRKAWAERTYRIKLKENKSTVRVFEYWDDDYRRIQVEDVKVDWMDLDHMLGFVPWYWCFNQVPGVFGQADIAETPKLQGISNDLLLLAMNALRRNIDKAFYAIGYKGALKPEAGKVIGFPNPNTQIGEFPNAVPPSMIMEVMQFIQSHAQSMAGISPISSEGMAEGSIVTGSAVRHQVEAIEARSEAKRTNLEATYAWLGETILKVYAKKLGDHEFNLRVGDGFTKHTGSAVGDWTRCEASYGSFEGLPVSERGNWAMQGLGRVHGRRTAIALAYPDRDVASMEREIDEYQLQQATLSAKAQAQAQQVLSSGQGPGTSGQASEAGQASPSPAGPALTPPQAQGRPPVPGLNAMGGQVVTLSDLQALIRLIEDQLKGDVYAVMDMAVVGMSVAPQLAVTREQDQALVQSAVQSKRAAVHVGVEEDEPKVQLNGG